MTLEDKKFLAEWMGWEIGRDYTPQMTGIFFRNGNKIYREVKWNPDTDHKQFAEVWNKLDDKQRFAVSTFLYEMDEPSFISIILNDLPKVMEAVLEVLKESK